MAENFVCPICLNVMIEPVTLPCGHDLCNICLENTLTEAAMLCPICRYRLSVWVRRTKKKGTIVDEEKWKRIKELFPNYVQEKLSGNNSIELTEAEESIIRGITKEEPPRRPLAAPGDLRREYELEVAREDKEREAEQAASLMLIRELEEEERELWTARQSICEADEELARKLASASPDPQALNSTPSSSASRAPCHSWLDRFMSEKQRLHSGAGSADSIGPELAPQFRPIETYPLSPSKSGSGTPDLAGRDCPLRPRALPTESMKENVCSPTLTRQKSRVSAGGVTKAKASRKVRTALGTSEGTAFRPVGVKINRNIIHMMMRNSQEESDRQLALELQKKFDLEHRLTLSALRFKDDEDAYLLRKRDNESW